MATFYVLPSRAMVGQRLAALVRDCLPGMPVPSGRWGELADGLLAMANTDSGAHLVYEEDLPFGVPLEQALAEGFGAERQDEIIEVRQAVSKWT